MDSDSFRLSKRLRAEAVVLTMADVTPRMRCLTLGGGADLRTLLLSAGADVPAAWVKVFPPGREGRAYTIRRADPDAGILDIEFVLHGDHRDDGSLSAWARHVKGGDQVSITGPRSGGFQLHPDSRWLWIAADMSALPTAQTILASLPTSIDAYALFEVEDECERQAVRTRARLYETWRQPSPSSQIVDAGVPAFPDTSGSDVSGQVWIAGEAGRVKHWRTHWLQDRNFDRQRLSAKGYWKLGERNHRD